MPLDRDDLVRRFEYHPPRSDERVRQHHLLREQCFALATVILATVPAGREQSLAITHLEEVMFWANGGLARSPDPQAPPGESSPAGPEPLTG